MARRREIERLKEENERYKVELQVMRGVANSYKLHYENARKEIGEEIHRIIGECRNETWVCLLIKEFADRLINGNKSNAETCIACGDVIPEGRWMCPNCEGGTK